MSITSLQRGAIVLSFAFVFAPMLASANSANLIANPGFETNNGTTADGWEATQYPDNSGAAFSISADSHTGTAAAEVGYATDVANAEARWLFTPNIEATSSIQTYTFSDWYKSATTTSVFIYFSDNSVQWIGDAPATGDAWSQFSADFTVQPGLSFTVGHALLRQGTLDTDDYSLIRHEVDPSCVATPVDANNKILNPSFANDALNWNQDTWGSNNAALSITSDAHLSDCKAANVTITSYTSGDAKWTSAPVDAAGKYFTYSEWYKSSTTTQVGYFCNVSAGCPNGFNWLADLPSTGNTWTQYQTDILVPVGVTSIKMTHLLFSVGSLTTDDYSLVESAAPIFAHGLVTLSFDDGWDTYYANAFPILKAAGLKSTAYIITKANSTDPADYMTNSQIKQLAWSGLVEIGSHTRNHVDLVKDNPADFGYASYAAMLQGEIADSLSDLKSLLPTSTIAAFAYPYGSYRNDDNSVNSDVRSLISANYTSARSVDDGFNLLNTDKFALKQKHITNTTTFADARSWIDTATSTKTWLVFMFHDVRQPGDPCVDREHKDVADQDCTTTTLLQQIVDYLKEAEAKQPGTVVTSSQGVAAMNGSDITAPHITIAAPVNGSTITTATTTISGTTDDTADVHLSLNSKFYTATLSAGTWSVTLPDADALPNGTYTIEASSTDTSLNTGSATASFTVAVVANSAPVASDLNISTLANAATSSALKATDVNASDVLTFATTTSPSHGTLTVDNATGSFTYTPAADYIGTDSFSFKANDGALDSNIATVSITVSAIPDTTAPSLNNISAGTPGETGASITWTTDEAATGQVYFGTTTDYSATTTLETALATNHSFALSGLSSGTTYHFVVVSTDASGNTATSSDATFTTATPSNNNGGGNSCTGCGCGGCGGGGGGGGISGSGPLSLGFVNTNPTGGLVLGASTGGLSETQIDAILNLLRSFNADQSVIDNVSRALHGTPGSSTSGKFIFTKTLQVGSTGNDVTQLQSRLTLEGVYSGPITGYFGSLTKAAVIKYQAAHGISQVGIVGPQTRAELNK